MTRVLMVAVVVVLLGCSALDAVMGVPVYGPDGQPAATPGASAGAMAWELIVGALGVGGVAAEGLRRGYVAHRLQKRGDSRAQPVVDEHTKVLREIQERLDALERDRVA